MSTCARLLPTSVGGYPRGLGALLWRHGCGTRSAAFLAAFPAQRNSGRILPLPSRGFGRGGFRIMLGDDMLNDRMGGLVRVELA